MKHGLLIAAALFVIVASAQANTIAKMETDANGALETLDNSPVITAIMSKPGTFNGKTYSSWSFSVNDGTGSAFVYGTLPGGYTPVVGDAITVSGKNAPYHKIPELGTISAISAVSNGNAVPAPLNLTINDLNVVTPPNSIAGYMVTLTNVTIGADIADGVNQFGISNLTSTITDASGNSMTFYYWPTSYSVSNVNLFNQIIPTGPVNMTGFVSVYGTNPEFTPISVTPEPATMALLAVGGLVMARRRK